MAAWLFLAMPSCVDLTETVYDKLPGDTFGSTETEVNALVGNIHNTLKTYWPNNFFYLSENSGSMAVTPTRLGGDWYDGGQYRDLYMHTWTSQTSCIKNSWEAATSAIGACNAAIQIIQDSEALTDEQRTEKEADVRGIRAFWIYVMMDFWGNVPLLTEYSSTDKVFPDCTPRQEVFDWLVEEVREIADNCPAPTQENYACFTQGAAYTLLAKLFLNADAWGVTTSEDNYALVVDYCDKVMAMGYSLEPVWSDNFSTSNNNSKEAIFACAFSANDTENTNSMYANTLHYKDNLAFGASFGANNGVCAQPGYVKLFPDDDPRKAASFLIGKQYNASTGEIIITDHGYELDHTIDLTIIPGTEYSGSNWGAVNQHDGARCQKWPYAQDLVSAMENDFHIFRLADVYLMKAEALLRGGGSANEATELVNAIRSRAYGNADHNYSSVTLNEVQLERRLELAWEATSRQDDIRFDCFETGMWPESNCERAADEYLKLMPVSQDAWQVNPNLTQNPGYPAF